MHYCKMSIGLLNKIMYQHLDDEFIISVVAKPKTEDSSVVNNPEKLADLDLEIESLTQDPDLVIEEFIASTSHIKDKSKIGTEQLRKVYRVGDKIA